MVSKERLEKFFLWLQEYMKSHNLTEISEANLRKAVTQVLGINVYRAETWNGLLNRMYAYQMIDKISEAKYSVSLEPDLKAEIDIEKAIIELKENPKDEAIKGIVEPIPEVIPIKKDPKAYMKSAYKQGILGRESIRQFHSLTEEEMDEIDRENGKSSPQPDKEEIEEIDQNIKELSEETTTP